MSQIKNNARTLAELCEYLALQPLGDHRIVQGLCCDTRHLKTGDLFCAYPGEVVDGRDFIAQAMQRGACAILYEAIEVSLSQRTMLNNAIVPTIAVPSLKKQLGYLASHFYGHPSKTLSVVATTGTNGKTTCSYVLAMALSRLQHKDAVIGTIGFGFPPALDTSQLTTPDPIQLHREMALLQQQGARTIVLEASSHGLHQGRLNGMAVDIAVLTNLTQDHFDYHGGRQQYAAAKRLLFELPGLKYAVLNADDAFGRELWKTLPVVLQKYRYSLRIDALVDFDPQWDIVANHVEMLPTGTRAMLKTPWGEGELCCPLLGEFNLSNMLAVCTCLGLLKFPMESILSALSQITAIPGRLECFGGYEQQPLVVVDYAHTPDAIENVLKTLSQYKKGRLICVFGCGGDRDRSKRAQMGQIVAHKSDFFIVTNDNPRSELPEHIAEQIMQGVQSQYQQYALQLDRRKAILQAIGMARRDDIVLIAGKGHEQYQIIGDKKLYFSDQEQVRQALLHQGESFTC
jgi:UDP-N-acetylmuramoyl-L-alanyl-D-glutamate--2,6-diaminopimelate ligase